MGSLKVYAAGPRSLMRQLCDDFEADTGIRVKLVQGSTGRILSRLEAEQDNPQADVFVSASRDVALDLERRELLVAYRSSNAATVPEAFSSSGFVSQAMAALALVWSTVSDTPEPSDWIDLVKPVYRNRVVMPDPAQSGTALDLVSGLYGAMGESVWQMFSALRDNGMIITGANDQTLVPVLQNDKAVAFGAVDYVAYGNLARGADIKVIVPRSGTVVVPRPAMIIKGPGDKDAARAFIDFLLSEAGQDLAADAWLMPARSDIGSRRQLSDIRQLPLMHSDDPLSRTAILERFQQIFDR